jgi:phage-related holin
MKEFLKYLKHLNFLKYFIRKTKKCKFMIIIKNLLLTLLVLFTPLQEAIYTVAVLIILDTITGVWAAKKRGEIFSSRKFFDSVAKIFIYDTLIIMAYLIEKYLLHYVPCLQLVLAFIAITEFTSLLENAGFIINRDVVTYFKEQLKNFKNFKQPNDKK